VKRIQEHLEAQARNARFAHYEAKIVRQQLDEVLVFSSHFFESKQKIDADKHLTPEGKAAARAKAREPIVAEITKWKDKRLTGLHADISAQRAALQPTAPKVEPRRIDALESRLRSFSLEEIATLYSSAPDGVRVDMEATALAVGLVPFKSGNGLEWKPLLTTEVIQEAVLARALKNNPAGAAKLGELEEIMEMHQTAANIAIAEIQGS
jgi:hypothetical protein